MINSGRGDMLIAGLQDYGTTGLRDYRTTGLRDYRTLRINHGFPSAANPQPDVAKRLECVELAPALGRGGWLESASKLAALQTLREVRQRGCGSRRRRRLVV